VARYTSARWFETDPRRRWYGDLGSTTKQCFCVHVDDDETWFVVPPSDQPWPDIVFPDLQTAKTWVEIEASNHGQT